MERLRDGGGENQPPQVEAAARAVRRLGPWRNPPGYKERVRRGIETRAGARPRWRRRWPLGLVLVGAVAGAAIGLVVREDPSSESPTTTSAKWPKRRSLPMLVVPRNPNHQSDWRPNAAAFQRALKMGVAPAPPAQDWSAGFETGDRSEWRIGALPDRNGFYEREGLQEAVTQPVHGGRYALKLTIDAAEGQRKVTYLYRDGSLPREGWYSAWFYFPARHQAPVFWSIMSFRGRGDPGDQETLIDNLWNLTVYNREDGAMALKLWDGARQRDLLQPAPIALPIGRWVHLEAYFRQASDEAGRIAFWQDGTPLYDLDGISTAPSEWTSWLVGSVGMDVSPSPTIIYVDDVSIRAGVGHEGPLTPRP